MRRAQLSLFGDESTSLTLRDVAEAVREAGIEGLPDAHRRADDARYQEVATRSALTATTGMPFKWALNPYRGCTHACEYCYARKYQRHLDLGAGDDFSSLILVKPGLPAVLARELQRPSWTHETVAVGTATDPYQPIEGHYRITRRCLEVLCDHETPFSVVTKGPMVVRDTDVLVRASARAGCRVYMSVATVDRDSWLRLEPGTASPDQRLRALRQLSDAGVDCGVLMMPLLPGITTSRDQIRQTIQAIADAGVRLVGVDVARLDEGVKAHFMAFLGREYPDLVAGYQRLYAGNRPDAAYAASLRAMVNEERVGMARPQGNAVCVTTPREPARPPTNANAP